MIILRFSRWEKYRFSAWKLSFYGVKAITLPWESYRMTLWKLSL